MNLGGLVDGVAFEMYTAGPMLLPVCGLWVYMLVCIDYRALLLGMQGENEVYRACKGV